MTKIFFLLPFIFFHIFSYCQKPPTGAVTYSYEFMMPEEYKNQSSKRSNNMAYQAFLTSQRAAQHIEITLQFNGDEARSYVEPMMDMDGYSFKTVIAGSGYTNPIYNNLSTQETLVYSSENFFEKHKYVVELDNLKMQWKLLDETKTIKGYLCYKATGVYVIEGSDRIVEHPVMVWYSPEIPINFGPLGYGNLPGLIMELEVHTSRFTFKKIAFNQKEIKIDKPDKGERISNQEYSRIVRETMRNR